MMKSKVNLNQESLIWINLDEPMGNKVARFDEVFEALNKEELTELVFHTDVLR